MNKTVRDIAGRRSSAFRTAPGIVVMRVPAERRSWLALHAVDLAFFSLLAAAFLWLLRITSDAYFVFGDWRLLRPSIRGLVQPYNDHLSLAILSIYRGLIEVFGFSYTPFRVAGLLSLVSLPVLFFVTTRRALGPLLAALAGLSMLAFANLELFPENLNHYLGLVGGIVAAATLRRGRSADLPLAGALGLSLGAAGGGLAVAAACVVHTGCTRQPRRRWLAVLAPCTLWLCWWLLEGQTRSKFRPSDRPSIADAIGYARDVAWTPFAHLSMGVPLLATALAIAFVTYGAWQIHQGLRVAASFLAWSVALLVWSAGLAYARGSLIRPAATGSGGIYFRYQLLALGFALLAVVPRRPIAWPFRLSFLTTARWQWLAAAVVLVVGLSQGLAMRDDVLRSATWVEGYGRNTRGELLVLGLGPEVIPDRSIMGQGFASLRAREVRALLERFGHPVATSVQTIDQQLVDLGIASAAIGTSDVGSCQPVEGVISWLPTSPGALRLSSERLHWTVEVRRFGTEWIRVADASADDVVALRLPVLAAAQPWQVRAEGACRSAARPG